MPGEERNVCLELPMPVARWSKLTDLGTHGPSTDNETNVGPGSEISSAIEIYDDGNVLFSFGGGIT